MFLYLLTLHIGSLAPKIRTLLPCTVLYQRPILDDISSEDLDDDIRRRLLQYQVIVQNLNTFGHLTKLHALSTSVSKHVLLLKLHDTIIL